MPFPPQPDQVTVSLIQRALGGDKKLEHWLASVTLTIVDRKVRASLSRLRRGDRALAEELAQDVMLYLWDDRGRWLRAWDPALSSYRHYIGMVAWTHARQRLTGFRGNPCALTLVDAEVLEHHRPARGHSVEQQIEYRLALLAVYRFIDTEGSETDRRRFRAIYVDRVPIVDLAASEGIKPDAIYAWSHRLKRRLCARVPRLGLLF